jgi:hypothetical protein
MQCGRLAVASVVRALVGGHDSHIRGEINVGTATAQRIRNVSTDPERGHPLAHTLRHFDP